MLKCIVIGNIGSDPELRYTSDGRPRLTFSVASNYRAKSQSGEWEDRAEWVRVTVFGDRAETLGQHLTRGARVYVDGRLESRPWVDRANNPRAGLEVVAATVEFVSSRERDDQDRPRQPVAAGARYATGADDQDLEEVPF